MALGQHLAGADGGEQKIGKRAAPQRVQHRQGIGRAGLADDHDLHRLLQEGLGIDEAREREEIAADLAGEGADERLGAVAIGILAGQE